MVVTGVGVGRKGALLLLRVLRLSTVTVLMTRMKSPACVVIRAGGAAAGIVSAG